VGLKLAVPEWFNRSLAKCSETEKSWYSTVYTCQFSPSEEASGQFSCTGSIIVDSQDGKEVEHNVTVSLELSVYSKCMSDWPDSFPHHMHPYCGTMCACTQHMLQVCIVVCIIWFLLPAQPTIVHLYQASELGSRLALVCEVDCSSFLACSVSWLYNGLAIDHTNPMYVVSSNGSIHNLSVLQPGEGEVGKYTCVLSSRFHVVEDSKTIQLVLPGETVG